MLHALKAIWRHTNNHTQQLFSAHLSSLLTGTLYCCWHNNETHALSPTRHSPSLHSSFSARVRHL